MLRGVGLIVFAIPLFPMFLHLLMQATGVNDSGTICIPWWAATSVVGSLAAAVVYQTKRAANGYDRTDVRLDRALDRISELEDLLLHGARKEGPQ